MDEVNLDLITLRVRAPSGPWPDLGVARARPSCMLQHQATVDRCLRSRCKIECADDHNPPKERVFFFPFLAYSAESGATRQTVSFNMYIASDDTVAVI